MQTFSKIVSPLVLAGALLHVAAPAVAAAPTFRLSSPDLVAGVFTKKFELNGFGCNGANVSPALEWANPPAGTQSFAIQVIDIDAPSDGFWHWAVYAIPATSTHLAQGAGNAAEKLPPPAFGGITDFQDTGVTGGNGNYGGPCPPLGDKAHRLVFTIYALGVENPQVSAAVPKTGTAALYSFVFNKGLGDKLLGKASFTASYRR